MADSKYKDLPGIAYDQADVYETQDLPESDQNQEFVEDENDSIESLKISATEAFNKFKGKHVRSDNVDFSDRISRRSRTGYNVVYGEWELTEQGTPETPLQKLRRLQCEIKDLYDEINEAKEKSSDKQEVQSLTDVIPQVQSLGKELSEINLNELLGSEKASDVDPHNTKLTNLVRHIETFKQSGGAKDTASKASAKAEKSRGDPGVMKYEMVYLPEKTRAIENKNIAVLEQRLANLEKVIGSTNSEKTSKFLQTLKSQGVLDAAQQLGTKASLLDSNQLDALESRISSLLQKMDNLAQKKSSIPQDSEMEQKIAEMYEILKQTEENSVLLPQTLDRMLTLQAIHQQAARFNKSLTQLEEMESQTTTSLEGNKALLQGVQESFASNLELIKKNIAFLEERVKKLAK